MKTKNDLFIQAQKLGAISVRYYTVKYRGENIIFSYHFFNSDDIEICYYIVDLINTGLFVFDEPRIWSNEFKNSSDYTLEQLF